MRGCANSEARSASRARWLISRPTDDRGRYAMLANMVEPLLIYGVASLASSAAKNLLGLEDDYGFGHVAGHAFHGAVIDGVKKLRETFTAHRPDRNHDLMEALQRAYLQTPLHLVLPWAETQGVQARPLLKSAKAPQW